jgi:alanyl-tRNA synthetase
VTEEEMQQIENRIIEAISRNEPLQELRDAPIEQAKQMGAMALFGEKYGDTVRVIQFGDSVELCGGTHIASTGKIGMFKILSESAVAAGVRRIEAISGQAAETYFRDRATQFENISALFKHPKDVQKAIEELLNKQLLLQKEIESFQKEKVKETKKRLHSLVEKRTFGHYLSTQLEMDAAGVKDILFQLKGEFPSFVGIIGHQLGDKCGVAVMVDENLSVENNWKANEMIKNISPLIQGGGGGQAFFATAGGKKKEGLKDAFGFDRHFTAAGFRLWPSSACP